MSEKSTEVPDSASRAVAIFHNPISAWVILMLGFGFTGFAWYLSSSLAQESLETRFDFRTQEITKAVKDRMIVYEQVLWGGVGLFNASDDVSRENFKRYVASLEIDQHWPGIQGIGFSVPVSAQDKESHIATIRAEGFPDYTIKPTAERDEYSAIVFLEPFDWRNKRAFGFDMWSNAMRREAMTRARDTGVAATSGVITLVQETSENVQRGFLTYVPLYKRGLPTSNSQERRDAFLGWVYSPFRMGDLMNGVVGTTVGSISFQIFDGDGSDPETMLYDSDPTTQADPESNLLMKTTRISLQGRDWTVRFAAAPSFASGWESTQPTAVAIGGLLVDLLLFYVITALAFLQRRARSIAGEMNAELREAHEQLKKSQAHLIQNAKLAGLGEMGACIAHELRQPLTGIGGLASAVKSKLTDVHPESVKHLAFIERLVEQMAQLLSNIRTFSREAGHNPEPTKAGEPLAQAVALVGVQLKELGIGLEEQVDLLLEEQTILGDPVTLQQVFVNLLGNARDAIVESQNENKLVRVGMECGKEQVVFTVEDSGNGISDEAQEKLFDAFFTTKAVGDGTGLGLALSESIVQEHGGTITHEASPDLGGAKFKVSLPLEYSAS